MHSPALVCVLTDKAIIHIKTNSSTGNLHEDILQFKQHLRDSEYKGANNNIQTAVEREKVDILRAQRKHWKSHTTNIHYQISCSARNINTSLQRRFNELMKNNGLPNPPIIAYAMRNNLMEHLTSSKLKE